MHVMGSANWWAPRWLRRVHDRLGIDDEPATPFSQVPGTTEPTDPDPEVPEEKSERIIT